MWLYVNGCAAEPTHSFALSSTYWSCLLSLGGSVTNCGTTILYAARAVVCQLANTIKDKRAYHIKMFCYAENIRNVFSFYIFSFLFNRKESHLCTAPSPWSYTVVGCCFFSVEDWTCLVKLHNQYMLFRCQLTSGFSVSQVAVSQTLPVDFNTVNSCSLAGNNFIDLQTNHGLMLTDKTVLIQILTVRCYSQISGLHSTGSGSNAKTAKSNIQSSPMVVLWSINPGLPLTADKALKA